MAQFPLPQPIKIVDSGPPPNANYAASNKQYKGHGSPEGVVAGIVGDEYLDLDTGAKWSKMGPDEAPPRQTKDGWQPDGVDLADIRDFGVAPDSEDDQGDLIQTALDASAEEGFVLTVPDGIYLHTALTVSGLIRIRGTGKGKAIFKAREAYDSTNGLWTVQAGADVVFEDVGLHGNDQVNRILRINAGADVEVLRSKISNAYGSVSVSATVCGIFCGGGGTLRVLDSVVQDLIAEPDGDNTGNVPGTVRGISIAKQGSEDPPTEVLISRCTFKNILSGDGASERNEDSDAIAYQSFGQDTKGNVKVIGNHFHNIGKRWMKILSPGVIFADNDGTNESTSTRPMYAIVSANSSDITVARNHAVGGAVGLFCDVGNPGAWACNNVHVVNNYCKQSESDPYTSAEGCRTFGGTSELCSGVKISDNDFIGFLIGVHVNDGSVGVVVTDNYIEATEACVHVSWRYNSENLLNYPDPDMVLVHGNVGMATTYGLRWKGATQAVSGDNLFEAGDALIVEGDYATTFVTVERFNQQIRGGTIKGITAPFLVGSTTATTYGSETPQVQSIDTASSGGVAGLSAETRDGTRNRRIRMTVVDGANPSTDQRAGLETTQSSGGTVPFFIKLGGTVRKWIDSIGRHFFSDPTTDSLAVSISEGTSSPEGVRVANPGSIYIQRDGSTGRVFWRKESGTSNTGWSVSRNKEDFLDWGASGAGVDDVSSAFTSAVAARSHIVIESGTYSFADDYTIAAGVVLIMRPGAKLKPASGKKITINGEVQAGRHEIFDYSAGGKVAFGSFARMTFILPEWWGAVGDASTNNDTAFGRIYDAALGASENKQTLLLASSYYNFVAGFTVKSKTAIKGQGHRQTRLQFAPTSSGRLITLPEDGDNFTIEGVQLNCNAFSAGVRTTAIGAAGDTDEINTLLARDVVISNFNQYGFNFGSCIWSRFEAVEFDSVSNRVALGGTGDGSAICINFRSFSNAIEIGSMCRAGQCEQFLKTVDAASLSVENNSFEQSDATIDAVLNKTSFIDVVGSNVRIEKNYFEGIRSDNPGAVINITSADSPVVSENRLNGHRPGGSTSVSEIFVRINASVNGGWVACNTFLGVPDYYIQVNGSSQPVSAPQNTYLNNSEVPYTAFSQIEAMMSPSVTDLTMSTEIRFCRPQVTRITSANTNVATVQVWEKYRSGGSGSANDGVQVVSKLTNDAGNNSQTQVGTMGWMYENPADSTEQAKFRVQVMNTGQLATGFEALSKGGFYTQGPPISDIVVSAVDVVGTQKNWKCILTATGKKYSCPNPSAGTPALPEGWKCFVKLNIGGVGTGTVDFVNATDRIRPSGASSYSLSADGKYVELEYIGNNDWIIIREG